MANEPAVTLKEALLALGGMETLGGAAMFPLETRVAVPPVARGAANPSVQSAVPPDTREAGVQVSPLNMEVAVVDAVPPVLLTEIWVPSAVTPVPFDTPTGALLEPVKLTETLATGPSAIRLLFIPVARQIAPPVLFAHVRVLPAAFRAGPGVTTKLVI